MGVWEQVFIEPKWLTIFGLFMDLIGGVLIAGTAWFRVQVAMVYGGPGSEPSQTLWWRRSTVLAGGSLLAAGFALQMFAAWLQIIP